jgi:DNA-binding IscR family transcriptional regulator
LAKPPSEIVLNDLIEILDGPVNLIECLKDPKICQKTPLCVTRDIWKEVSDAINRIFHSITLQDMINRKREKDGQVPSMYQI